MKDFDFDTVVWYSDITEGDVSSYIPYKAGDIITVDCRPARKISHAVITESMNRSGSIRKTAIYFTAGGKLTSEIAHWHLNVYGMFHGFYRLEKSKGELPDYEAALKKISEEIKNNPALTDRKNINNYLKEFSNNMKNFMPDGTVVGDIIKISSSSCDCGGYDDNFYAVITDMNNNEDDVEVIQIYSVKDINIGWQEKCRKINLKKKLENRHGFVFERYTADMVRKDSEYAYSEQFIKISEELKRNPALANNDEFIEKLLDEKEIRK